MFGQDFWGKFQCFTKTSIFDQNLDFWAKFGFWPKFRFLVKVTIFNQHFDLWPKFRFLTKISIFEQHSDFWQIFDFWPLVSVHFTVLFYILSSFGSVFIGGLWNFWVHSDYLFWPQKSGKKQDPSWIMIFLKTY